MTNKQRAFARALAQGKPISEAATLAGYNLPYARKKAREPAVRALVERLTADSEREQAARDAVESLWTIINDPMSSPQDRTSAIRALIAYDRAHISDRDMPPVTIIDDVPVGCEKCPKTVRDLKGGGYGPDGDHGPGGDDREGCATAFR